MLTLLCAQGWQQKLTQLQVATFPWDPKPEPMVNPPTLPSNAGNYQSSSGSNPAGRVKLEPVENSALVGMSQPQYQAPLTLPASATTAQQRAALNLQATYGERATASINAIQGNVAQQPQNLQQQQQHNMQRMQQPTNQQQQMHQMQMPQQPQQMPQSQQVPQQRAQNATSQRPPMTQDQYRQAMASQTAQQQRFQNQNGVNGAQTDGAGDKMVEADGVIKQFDANGKEVSMGRVEIDHMIRQQIQSMGQSMEGGGLMIPLHKAVKPDQGRIRKTKAPKSHASQLDGQGSDDDEDTKTGILEKYEDPDEDAINSDLDDPDDGLNDEEDDDEGMGHIMLCMYDKVQRVKNKW